MPFIIMTLVYRPYKRGIYCDDETIRYPYRTDTISHKMMAAVTISCSIIIVSLSQPITDHHKHLCTVSLTCYKIGALVFVWTVLLRTTVVVLRAVVMKCAVFDRENMQVVYFPEASCSVRTLFFTQHYSSRGRVQLFLHESFTSDILTISLTFHLLWFPESNSRQNSIIIFHISTCLWCMISGVGKENVTAVAHESSWRFRNNRCHGNL